MVLEVEIRVFGHALLTSLATKRTNDRSTTLPGNTHSISSSVSSATRRVSLEHAATNTRASRDKSAAGKTNAAGLARRYKRLPQASRRRFSS
jgi:hypothetical protein